MMINIIDFTKLISLYYIFNTNFNKNVIYTQFRIHFNSSRDTFQRKTSFPSIYLQAIKCGFLYPINTNILTAAMLKYRI